MWVYIRTTSIPGNSVREICQQEKRTESNSAMFVAIPVDAIKLSS